MIIENYNFLVDIMEVLGKKWVVPLLLLLFLSEHITFSKLKKQLNITSRALSEKLRQLESLGFIEKIDLDTKKSYYSLSDKGKDLTQKILALH